MLDLMIPPIAAGLVILSIHAYLGLHVIARGVIFVDLAFAQIAALGATVGLLMGVNHDTPLALTFSVGFTLVGALIFSFSRLEGTIVPQEAVIGITFVVASAAVILIAGFTAEGAEHIAETLTGTLIWVGWPEIIRMVVVYTILGVIYFIFRKPFLSISLGEADRPRGPRVGFSLLCALRNRYLVFGAGSWGSHGVQFTRHSRGSGVSFHESVQRGALDRVGCRCGCPRERRRGVFPIGRSHRSSTRMYVRVGGGDRPADSVRCGRAPGFGPAALAPR